MEGFKQEKINLLLNNKIFYFVKKLELEARTGRFFVYSLNGENTHK